MGLSVPQFISMIARVGGGCGTTFGGSHNVPLIMLLYAESTRQL